MNPSTSQIELFEGFEPSATRAPRLALPFQKSNEIDVKRVRKILGVNLKTVRRMLDSRLLRGYRHPGAPWHIEYDSVVEYCDQLRVQHCISDQRAGLSGGRRRYRDHELLPFPLAQTVSIVDVQARLDCSQSTVVHLIQTGSLTGYQVLFEVMDCAWRIYAPSVERYIESLHVMAGKGPSSRRTPPSR